MSEEWKKLKDRLESGDMRPKPSDWDDMKGRIARHPSLLPVPLYKRGLFKGMVLIAGLLLLGGLAWWTLVPADEPEAPVSVQQESRAIIPNTPEPAGNENGLDAHRAINGSDEADLQETDAEDVANSESEEAVIANNDNTYSVSNNEKNGQETSGQLTASLSNSFNSARQQPTGDSYLNNNTAQRETETVSLKTELLNRNWHNLSNDLQPSLKLLESEEEASIIDPATGFKLNSVAMLATYGFHNTSGSYEFGLGVEVEFLNQNFFLQTGVHINAHLGEYNDSVPQMDFTEVPVQRVDSNWIIDGPFQGHYEIDTVISTHYDTTLTYRQITGVQRTNLRYLEIPVMAGYRWYSGRWSFDLSAGVISGLLTYNGMSDQGVEQNNGLRLDLALRPALLYRLNPSWSVIARPGLRYTILDQTPTAWNRSSKATPLLQVGLSCNW